MNKETGIEAWYPAPPFDFEAPYALGGYEDEHVRKIMFKYLIRKRNLTRAWTRICHHLPEVMSSDTSLDCLEFGTAHGATLEIWRALGHRAVGTDWPWRAGNEVTLTPFKPWHTTALEEVAGSTHDNPRSERIEGWAYQPIVESLGLDVRLIDGRDRPYPFADKSFDVVCAYQCIDAFAEPEEWPAVVAELCRIARQTVVVGYNPLGVEHKNDADRQAEAREAWRELQCFSAHGLSTVFTEFGQTRRGRHPVTTKLTAAAG